MLPFNVTVCQFVSHVSSEGLSCRHLWSILLMMLLLRCWFSADTKQEKLDWIEKLSQALLDLHTWSQASRPARSQQSEPSSSENLRESILWPRGDDLHRGLGFRRLASNSKHLFQNPVLDYYLGDFWRSSSLPFLSLISFNLNPNIIVGFFPFICHVAIWIVLHFLCVVLRKSVFYFVLARYFFPVAVSCFSLISTIILSLSPSNVNLLFKYFPLWDFSLIFSMVPTGRRNPCVWIVFILKDIYFF